MSSHLSDKTLHDLLAAFRSSDPTPGGGSASALAGAVGAALLAMVAGLARPRAANEDELARLAAAGRRTAEISEELGALVDRDSDAYDAVVAAYRLPKNTDDEKKHRSGRIQEALTGAIDTPLDVMRRCAAAMGQASLVASLGNANASSDVQVALELLSGRPAWREAQRRNQPREPEGREAGGRNPHGSTAVEPTGQRGR